MKAIFLALLLTTLTTMSALAEAPYRHVVLFKFKDTASKEQIQAVEEAFRELPKKVDTIQEFEWGTNVSPEGKDDGLTHCFFVTFKDKAGLEVYLPHPAHKEFGAKLKGLIDKVVVVDYVAKK
ncbi:MAG: Dabb family protein [Verrucomicrobium sp.]|nr:Dabb family protein [Verrucomicrobium sp.]